MSDEIRPETCQECKFYFDCRKSSIANAYGGLECAGKWRKKPPVSDEIRERFEKEFPQEATYVVPELTEVQTCFTQSALREKMLKVFKAELKRL